MGFFSELKEDLSQAVNELLPDENNVETPKIPNDVEELGELLGSMNLDSYVDEESDDEYQTEDREETTIEEDDYLDSDAEQEEAFAEEIESLYESNEPENEIPEAAADESSAPISESGETGESSQTENESEKEADSKMSDTELNEKEEETEDMSREEEAKMLEEITEMVDTLDAGEGNTENNEENEDNGGFRMDSQLANKSAVDETAVITAGMTIQGDIISEGSMEVIGNIIGNIDILGKLNITGSVQGNSKAAEIYCENAKISGEIASEGSVKIGQSTVIIGNISANSAVIAGAVKGDIDVHGPVVLDTSAIVMGNIKSKSVQINNGAVIEGMCSQCYADVSPSSFFEDFKTKTKKGNK